MKRFALTIVPAIAMLFTTAAHADHGPSSGMLLGIYAFPTWHGLRVTGTIPGYSAQGRLFRNDVVRRVTADGSTIFETKNLWQFEQAKDQIGPFRPAALEIYRPGQGNIYLWVEFRPVGGAAALRSGAPVQMKARIMTEKERPGARALFQGGQNKHRGAGNGGHNNFGPNFGPQVIPQPPSQNHHGNGNASSLFGK